MTNNPDYMREYRAKNKDKIKQKRKEYLSNNKEKIKEQRKQYYQKHKQQSIEYASLYREKNRDVINKKRRAYYSLHKEKCKSYSSTYKKKNKEKVNAYNSSYIKSRKKKDSLFKLTISIRSLISVYVNKHYRKNKKTEDILGCSMEEFYNYIESKFQEGMSWNNYGEWHLDHIKPISLAKTEEEVYELNRYTNFQPLWAVDNIKKSNKYDEEIE